MTLLFRLSFLSLGSMASLLSEDSARTIIEANASFYYYDRIFGRDLSDISYFRPVTGDEVREYASRVGRPKFIDKYTTYAMAVLLDFGQAVINSPSTAVIPSIFVLNEVNKLMVGPATPPVPALRSIGRAVLEVPPEWENSIQLIVESHRILSERGSVDVKVIMNCLFSSFTLLVRHQDTDDEGRYAMIMLRLHAMVRSGTWGSPKVIEGLKDLFGCLQMVLAGVGSSDSIVFSFEKLMEAQDEAARTKIGQQVTTGTLEKAVEKLNGVVREIRSFSEKPASWFVHFEYIASIDTLKRCKKTNVLTDIVPAVETALNLAMRDPKLAMGKLGFEYINLAVTWQGEARASNSVIPTMMERLMLVNANKIIDKFYWQIRSIYLPKSPKQKGLEMSAINAIRGVSLFKGTANSDKIHQTHESSKKVLNAYESVWTSDEPKNTIFANLHHILFDLILAHHFNWNMWIGGEVLEIQKALEDSLIASKEDPLSQEAYDVLEDIKTRANRVLEESYYWEPTTANAHRLAQWKVVVQAFLKRQRNEPTGTGDMLNYPESPGVHRMYSYDSPVRRPRSSKSGIL